MDFLTYLFFLITILLGYVLGRLQKPERDIIEIGKKAKSLFKEEIPTGLIKPKDAATMWFNKRPQKEREGLMAMKETLDNLDGDTEHKT